MPSPIIEYIKSQVGLNEESFKQLNELVEQYPYCSTFRILLAKNHKVLNTAEAALYYRNTAVFSPDRKKFFHFMNDVPEENLIKQPPLVYSIGSMENNEMKVSGNSPGDDLIDKFLREQPKIQFTLPDHEMEEEEMPAESENEPDLVSEILAELYRKQGNPEKAIRTYEKLCLKIPEKSSYFAAQIEKIKKESFNH
jgi:hypothetical protein